jgi:hypothetical protein
MLKSSFFFDLDLGSILLEPLFNASRFFVKFVNLLLTVGWVGKIIIIIFIRIDLIF